MIKSDLIGFVAGILTSINIVPQLIKTYRSKTVEDISLSMFIIYDMGLLMWVIYGYLISSLPLFIMDGFACITSLIMTYFKVRYDSTLNPKNRA